MKCSRPGAGGGPSRRPRSPSERRAESRARGADSSRRIGACAYRTTRASRPPHTARAAHRADRSVTGLRNSGSMNPRRSSLDLMPRRKTRTRKSDGLKDRARSTTSIPSVGARRSPDPFRTEHSLRSADSRRDAARAGRQDRGVRDRRRRRLAARGGRAEVRCGGSGAHVSPRVRAPTGTVAPLARGHGARAGGEGGRPARLMIASTSACGSCWVSPSSAYCPPARSWPPRAPMIDAI